MKCGAALCRRKRWELKLASTAKLTRKSTTSTRYADSQMRTAAHMPSAGEAGTEEATPGPPEASPEPEGCEACAGVGTASAAVAGAAGGAGAAGAAGCEACAGWEVASVEALDESFLERLDLRLMERSAPRAGAGATARARKEQRRGARDRDRP